MRDVRKTLSKNAIQYLNPLKIVVNKNEKNDQIYLYRAHIYA